MTPDEETDLAEKLVRLVSQCMEEKHIAKENLTIDNFLNWVVDKANKSIKRKKKKDEIQNINISV